MTTIRLVAAWAQIDYFRRGLGPAVGSNLGRPALLVSYAYWDVFEAEREHYDFRDYSLDSGAFSVQRAGQSIDLNAYIEFCRDRLANDPACTEVFALDVIGDWRESMHNTERMWDAGVPAIPTYHVGEPEHVLKDLAANYPKIALGGAVGMRGARKVEWARQCFARVWPKPIHGLGFGSETQVMTLPFHSVDCTSWVTGPAGFGNWKSMPGGSMRGSRQPLRMEVEWYLRLEQRARARWRSEMSDLDAMMAEAAETSPTMRLAISGHSGIVRSSAALAPEGENSPSLRLVSAVGPMTPAARRESIRDSLNEATKGDQREDA